MTFKQFIKENKEEIDRCIKKAVPDAKINDDERRLWILNEENLYLWARRNGVRI